MLSPLLRLVTVDINNTIIRIMGSPGMHYALVAAQHGVKINEDALTHAFYNCYKEQSGRYPNFGASCQMPAYKWWTDLVTEIFETCGFKDREVVSNISRDLYHYYATPRAWELLPGAMEALQQLQSFDVKMGVISNFDHRLYKILTDMKLREYFNFVLPSYVVGVEKPNPFIFRRALEDANVSAKEAVHFGDNIEKDFIGARNAGFTAYLLETQGVNHSFLEDKYVVRSAGEFVMAITPHLKRRSQAAS